MQGHNVIIINPTKTQNIQPEPKCHAMPCHAQSSKVYLIRLPQKSHPPNPIRQKGVYG